MAADLEKQKQSEQFRVLDPANIPTGLLFRSNHISLEEDSAAG